MVGNAKKLVQPAYRFPFHVLRGCCGHHIFRKQPIEPAGRRCPQRPLDIAKQHDTLMLRGVGSMMNEGLVEHHRLAITPVIGLTIDLNVAARVIGRDQSKVITQRARIGITVPYQSGAGRQGGKHRRFDTGNLL